MTIDSYVLMRIGDWTKRSGLIFAFDGQDLSCFWSGNKTIMTHVANSDLQVLFADRRWRVAMSCQLKQALTWKERRALVRFLRAELRRMVLTETLNGISK